MIFNFLDHLTVEDVIKYAAIGFEINISNGHVQSMVLRREEGAEDGEQTANT